MDSDHKSTPFSIRFDNGRNYRAKLGFVVLAMEQTIEKDMFLMAPPGVGLHFSRVKMANTVSVDTLKEVGRELAGSAALILPEGDLDVVCYACTSGSLVLGEKRVRKELNRGAPKAVATSLITTVKHALRAVNAKKIVVATPYIDEINVMEADYLKDKGFTVLDIQGLNIEKDEDMVRVEPAFLKAFAKSIDRPEADAIFISCGALRSIDILDELEGEVNKPVIASNQAMMWETLRLAGVKDRIEGYGKLLREH